MLEVYDLMLRDVCFSKKIQLEYSISPTSEVFKEESFCTQEFTQLPHFFLFFPLLVKIQPADLQFP